MKKVFTIKLLTMVLLLVFLAIGHTQANKLSGIKLGGYLQTDNRILLNDENIDFSRQEYRVSLKIDAKPTDLSGFYTEVWLSAPGFPTIQESKDMSINAGISPLNLIVREAYMVIYGFLLENFDIKIGRQRIAWGKADTLNPTDNLNPDDLEDIWDFGRHLGSDAFKANLYLDDFSVEAVFIPLFVPAVLPQGNMSSVLTPTMEFPPGMTVKNMNDMVIMPENSLNESSITGIKLLTRLFEYDFSVSYVYGRDDLPVVSNVKFTPVEGESGEVDVESKLIFPRMNIIGIDMAGALGEIGVWAETAVFIPNRIILITDMSAMGMGIKESIALDDKPYVRYVAGMDYTFKNGMYINGQFMRGFIHERGEENLENYFMFAVEWKTLEDKLKIIPFGGGFIIKEFQDIENNYAYVYSPEIAYTPVDNAEIILGARWIEGTDTTAFGKMREYDEAYLKVKYSF